ncbi:MAG: hypothetical protein AAGM22_30745 [Acidobacteriota bacterium]
MKLKAPYVSTALLLILASAAFFFISPDAAQANSVSVSLNCPILGGTCEVFPEIAGAQYFYRAQGNAFISSPTPVTSPVATVGCLPLLEQTGQVTVTVVAPGGQSTTLSSRVCPGRPGPTSPF